MTNRSPAVSLALLIVPTMCIVALRFGIPALDEVISNDFTLEAALHVIAILVGLFMVTRYSRIEDHEYHRSKAIGRLSKTLTRVRTGDFGTRGQIRPYRNSRPKQTPLAQGQAKNSPKGCQVGLAV